MSSLNIRPASKPSFNSAGTVVPKINKEQQLVRMTLAHMLWEDQFYVDGKTSAQVMQELIKQVDPNFVANLAVHARHNYKLRHIPLFLTRELARNGKLQAQTLADVIARPDEMSEFLSIYWKDKKQPLSNAVKKGLATAFKRFDEYSLAKWDKNSAAVSLRDVMFLTHPKPDNITQADLFKKVANKALATPDTWETELSAGADKKVTFERLMHEKKLGALAFLRNLRNMVQSGINESLIRQYAKTLNVDKVLPFRYIAAARILPQFEDMLEEMMFRSLKNHPKLPGKTVLLVDCSGSMFGTKVSAKSELDRFDAASALAMYAREICEEVVIYGFADNVVQVPPRRGFALREAIKQSCNGGTDIPGAIAKVNANNNYDRCIIFTDEQATTGGRVQNPKGKGYVFNVAAYQNGINHSDWVTITGFSEAMIDFVQAYESTF